MPSDVELCADLYSDEARKRDVRERISSSSDVSKGPTKDFFFLPIPVNLRYHSDKPPSLGVWMNIWIGVAASFLVSNIYYCQPLLIQMADTFHMGIDSIPTLIQAGFAVGLFFVCPLGDLVRRRQLILLLISYTTCLTIGLAVTKNLVVFQILSFFLGLGNMSPQILAPLAADLASPEHRRFAYSIVLTGIVSGIIMGRVLAGVMGQFLPWHFVYYVAIGVQSITVFICYWILPDCPSKNESLSYWTILWSMVKFALTEPLVIQVELITITTSACFSSYWVTLTFLLGGPPYNYSTLLIGLFGLLGLGGMCMAPFAGRLLGHIPPWHGIVISTILLLLFQAVQTAAGGINISAVIVACIGIDAVRQIQNVSIATKLFSIDIQATSRLNGLFILSFYGGQLMGTPVGTKVFVEHGWRACAALGMAWYGAQLVIILLRGPNCSRRTWFGYEGGIRMKKA